MGKIILSEMQKQLILNHESLCAQSTDFFQFINEHYPIFEILRRNQIHHYLLGHIMPARKKRYTLDEAIETAKKCITRTVFGGAFPRFYQILNKHDPDLLDQLLPKQRMAAKKEPNFSNYSLADQMIYQLKNKVWFKRCPEWEQIEIIKRYRNLY